MISPKEWYDSLALCISYRGKRKKEANFELRTSCCYYRLNQSRLESLRFESHLFLITSRVRDREEKVNLKNPRVKDGRGRRFPKRRAHSSPPRVSISTSAACFCATPHRHAHHEDRGGPIHDEETARRDAHPHQGTRSVRSTSDRISPPPQDQERHAPKAHLCAGRRL